MSYISSKTSNLDPVINYITNGRAYNSTEGWSTYAESDAVTFQDTGDTVTLNSHGLSNGTLISFTSITSTTGISINTAYYVVNATTNTFQVATSVGGSALPLTTNGSGTLVRSIPKLGTGGSPSVTFTRNTTTPLRQGSDFRFAKDAANRMGQGVSYDFTIDDADLAKVLTISFDYELITATGTYANGDVTVYLIQDPTGTPVVIQPAGYTVLSAASGLPVKEIATFQTSNSVKSYRLCVHVASVSATAYTLAIDNVQVGPQVVQYGAPITDWQAYTPSASINQGLGTLANVDVYWRRVGTDIEIRGSFTTGTVAASEARLALPAGLSTTSDVTQNTIIGVFGRGVSTATKGGFMIKQHNVNYVCFSANAVFSGNTTISTNPELGSAIFGSGDKVSIQLSVPIQGWSSTVQMSNDTDTRVVAARIMKNGGSATANTTISSWTTAAVDTHGAMNLSTGVYTVPVPGIYYVELHTLASAAGGGYGRVKIDGVTAFQNAADEGPNQAGYGCSGLTSFLNAGQQITVELSVTKTLTSTTTDNFLNIFRLSGPSAIAASETVAARYGTSAAPTVNTTSPIITYGTKSYDTHGAMSGNTYTVPVAGIYRISFAGYANSVAWSAAGLFLGEALQNSVLIGTLGLTRVAAAVTTGMGAYGSLAIRCNAGDALQVRVYASSSTTLSANVNDNFICIERIGN